MSKHARNVAAIRSSSLFDARWYLEQYRDVAILGMDPAEHFLRIGARLGRNPGPEFDTVYYLGANQDVVDAGVHPFLHYLAHGRREGRACLPSPSPPPVASGAAGAEIQVRDYPGQRQPIAGAQTILVCAHVSGKHLFGGERSLLDILDGLAEAGYNAVVATPGTGNGAYLDALRRRCTGIVSFRYGWWRDNNAIDESVVAAFAQVIAEHRIDAVHANTIMLREPLAAARRMGIPGIVHVRELIEHDVALAELIGESPARIIQEVVAGTDWVIANSEATARSFAKAGATFVVPNTIDADAYDIGAVPGHEGLRVAMLSSNLPKKGIHDFVAVAEHLKDASPETRLLLFGPENDHTRALREAQQKGEVPSNLVFAGYCDDPARAMAEADVVVNLSHFQESFGRTVLEAMGARRPVVVYDWGALPELVVHGQTGFVVPFKDTHAVAARLLELARDPGLRRGMGEAARQRAVDAFARPHYAERLKQAYAEIFAAAQANPPRRLVLPARQPRPAPGAPVRIAYFLWHFPVPSETFVLNELRILVADGQDVEVFCRQSPHKDFVPDFPIRWTRVSDPADLAARLLETGRTIVHSHFTYPTVTEMVWPACEQAGIPFTFIAHAQDIFRHANDEKNRIGEIGRSPWCLRVIVPSRYHRRYVQDRGVPEHKLLVNPNGIDPDLYATGSEPARPSRERRSVCAIHRFTAKKGLEHLIRAGAALADDGIDIHLYGYGELGDAYRGIIEAEGLDNVFVHGPVDSREHMLAVFPQHDLFACPSVRADDGDMDGIPTVLMEAMASGIPVLTTGISGLPDLVQDEVTGIVCQADPASIASAVRRFYALPDSRVEAIIEDARALVRRDFNATRLTATLLRVWRQQTLDILVVSWNNLPQLREVIRRLQHFTSLPFHLVICDNGSGADVLAHLCRVYASNDNTTIVFNRDNVFVGPGTNICLDHGDSDYAVYVCGKEGFVLDHGWEKRLVDYMDENPRVGLAGTQCYSPSYLTGARYPEAIPLFDKFRNPAFAAANPERRFGHVQGGFFAIRRAMYDEIGGFSDAVPHNYTDVEYSYYAESRGWRLGTAPGMLALFNKTRPGLFSRIDESVAATHPPVLEDLPLLDRIANAQAAHCNLCGWNGDAFAMAGGESTCPECGSKPSDRSLYRYLAESMLTYRRLPALGVEVGPAMQAIWRHQFQGEMMSAEEIGDRLARQDRLEFNAGSLKLVYLDGVLDGAGAEAILAETDRVLAPDGLLLFTLPRRCARRAGAVVHACRLHDVEPVRFSSRVVRYDSRPLYVGRRAEVARCVS